MASWDVTFDLRLDLGDPELLAALYRAEAFSEVINQIPLPPAIREQLDQLNILRAVRGTTGIEGSDLSEQEVAKVLAAPTDEPVLARARSREEREVRNANRVMVFVARTLRQDPGRPLTEALICELHRLTTEGIAYAHNEPGHYRSHAVSAGDYVPPRSSTEVRALMARFADWLNGPATARWPAAARAIAAHFYFISIHPFGDGNGRTARAIESYLLYQSGINKLGFYSLANFYYRNRAEYIAMLDHVRFRSHGDLTPFVRFAAQGLLEELVRVRDEVLQANKVVAFQAFANDTIRTARNLSQKVRARLALFVAVLVQDGEVLDEDLRRVTHPLGAAYAALNPRTMRRDLDMLESLQLIRRVPGTVYANYEVMERYTAGPA